MSSSGTIVIYIIVIAVLLILNGILASNASDIADEKGYEKRKWFHMCFWLGPIPYIIISAMPDLKMRENQRETNAVIERLIREMSTSFSKASQSKKEENSFFNLPKL